MADNKKFVTCDGNWAAAHIAYLFNIRYKPIRKIKAIENCEILSAHTVI